MLCLLLIHSLVNIFTRTKLKDGKSGRCVSELSMFHRLSVCLIVHGYRV